MIWRQTGRLESKLLSGDAVLGTLQWGTGWGTSTKGETHDGKWSFRMVGLLTPKIVVSSDSGAASATLTLGWKGGGAIELPDGRSLRFARKRFWQAEWVPSDAQQNRLLTLSPDLERGRVGASVEVGPVSTSLRELPLLVMLCWYMVLLFSNESGDWDGAVVASLVATG